MGLSNFCIQRPVFTIVINVILAILGLWALKDLQVRQFPSLVLPSVTITTVYPGADPALVERQISVPIEAAVGAVAGIDSMSSTSQAGISTVQVNFMAGTDSSDAINQVRSKVSEAQAKLPTGIVAPVISQISTDGQPVLYLTFADPTRTDMAVTQFVRREMLPRLTSIPGVSQGQIVGERLYAIRLQLDPVRMAAFGVTVQDVSNALAAQNINTPGGQFHRPDSSINVVVDTALTNEPAFENLILRTAKDGYNIRLKDIGHAVIGPDQTLTSFRFRGKSAIAVGLVPLSSANPIDISRAVHAMLPELQAAAPETMKLELAFDTSVPIEASVDEVAVTIFIAIGLVLVVILFFLGSITTSMIPLVTIPLSLIGTLMFIDMLGFSINIFSLLAMVLAIGLVVDDAIVEVENVQRHVQAGLTAIDSSFLGSKEVGFAVIATTITLASVFAPMGLASGVVGQIFREFAFTLAISILLSGFIARTLSPMMCAYLIKPKPANGYAIKVDHAINRLTESYRGVLTVLLRHPWKTVLATLLITAAIFSIAGKVPASMSAQEDDAYLIVRFTAPTTANLEYLSTWTSIAEKMIAKQPEVANTLVMQGIPMQNQAMAIAVFKPWGERTRTSSEISDSIFKDLANLPGLQPTLFSSDPLAGVSAGQPVQWLLQTTNSFEVLANASDAVLQATKNAKTLQNVTSDLNIATTKLDVSVDRPAAADVGIPVNIIGTTIQSLLGGQRASTFFAGSDQYNVYIELEHSSTDALRDVFLSGSNNTFIPLRSLMNITAAAGPNVLSRTNQLNTATLGADPKPGHTVAEATAELKEIADSVLPSTVHIAASATVKAMERTGAAMGLVMLLSIIFIYLVLSAQFESFRDPAIILVVVPLTVFGAILGLYIFGGSYNLYSVIGLVALVGLIAKHGILIVEFANQLRDAGKDFNDAILDAAAIRLRPIVMTTVATVLGALPLALATGSGAGGRSQIGIVITVGMTLGTMVSLFVLPVVYSLMSRRVRHG
ncbi:MAG TPA: efflux RND transporter permease subunit, partial [Reyranella sp.]